MLDVIFTCQTIPSEEGFVNDERPPVEFWRAMPRPHPCRYDPPMPTRFLNRTTGLLLFAIACSAPTGQAEPPAMKPATVE
jgi:hypothetical protein